MLDIANKSLSYDIEDQGKYNSPSIPLQNRKPFSQTIKITEKSEEIKSEKTQSAEEESE